jgi:hypothetical protein
MAAVSRSVASLRVIGDALKVPEVSRLMGREPSLAYEKGDAFEVRGSVYRRKTGVWMIRVPAREPESLDAQISELLASVSASPQTWQQLREQFNTNVFCGLFLGEGNEGLSLEPATLSALAERNLTIDFDIYGPSPETDDRAHEV